MEMTSLAAAEKQCNFVSMESSGARMAYSFGEIKEEAAAQKVVPKDFTWDITNPCHAGCNQTSFNKIELKDKQC